jgi:hypothetical protein
MSDASVMSYDATVEAVVRNINASMKSASNEDAKLRAVSIEGPPGTGKTAMRHVVAKKLGFKHQFTIKLSHHDVPDVAGVPVPRDDTQRTHFYPSADMLPPSDLEGGMLVTIDEIGDCNVAQQNLACQMIFEGGIHTYKFPKDTYFLLTSNRVSDRSGANRIVTKLGNRCATYTVDPTPDELFTYGAMNNWNPTVLAFIKMKGAERINPSDQRAHAPTYFNSFDPSDPQQMAKPQFASSRSYEFASNYMNYVEAHEPGLDEGTVMGELAGILGTPVAITLVAFRKIAMTMPDPALILAGKKVPYPTKQEVMWALALTLASRADKKSIEHVHAFLDQGPPEYLALCARIVYDTKMPGIVGPGLHALIKSPKLKSMFTGV